VFKFTDNACAPSIMDERRANFGAVLHWAWQLNSAAATAETWDLKGHI